MLQQILIVNHPAYNHRYTVIITIAISMFPKCPRYYIINNTFACMVNISNILRNASLHIYIIHDMVYRVVSYYFCSLLQLEISETK